MEKEVYSRTKRTVDDWETPQYFFDLLDNEFHFTLDPCASEMNAKCVKYLTKGQNGLKHEWNNERVFVNPPYSHIEEWVKKCWWEGNHSAKEVVMLIPSRTDTKYWHKYVMKAEEIRFCVGRVNFLLNGAKPKNGSTFPSAVVVFNGKGTPLEVSSFYHKEKLKITRQELLEEDLDIGPIEEDSLG